MVEHLWLSFVYDFQLALYILSECVVSCAASWYILFGQHSQAVRIAGFLVDRRWHGAVRALYEQNPFRCIICVCS